MKRLSVSLVAMIVAATLAIAGCGGAAPAPAPTKAAEPAKPAAAQPTAAPAQPTAAPAQPTAAPAKKVDFPQKGKAVNFIVPWSAGGPTDLGARMLASQMEKDLNGTFEVVNRVGAGSQVGTAELANARPDGYTIGQVTIPTTLTIYLDPDRKATFTGKSFQLLALHVVDPVVIVVRADSPFKTTKDVIDAGKANPGKVKMSTVGVMQTNHLALLQLEKLTGAKFAPVFFEGSAQAMPALLGGHTDVDIGQLGAYAAALKGGQVRILGIADREQSRFAPAVTTLESQGYKMYYAGMRGYAAPAGTPKEIVDILAGSMKRMIQSDEHKKKAEEMNLTLRYLSPEDFTKEWEAQEVLLKELLPIAKAQAAQ